MKLAIFPTIAGILVFVSWLTVTLVDSCMLQTTDPKFGCSSSLQIVAVIAAISAVLTGMAAGLARVSLHAFFPVKSVSLECISAALSGIVLVLLFSSAILWEVDIGGLAGMFFGWLSLSLLICGTSLAVVTRFTKAA